jgi:sec-independent protein translocase protein TatB
VFNFSGSELVFLLILGLVILGPEKLPGAIRKAGRLYGEFRRITSDAQSEFRDAFREPMQEIQQTARGYKQMFTEAAEQGVIDEPEATPSDATQVPTSDGADVRVESDVTPSDADGATEEAGS